MSYVSATAYIRQTWIPRIPFSALMLKTAVDVSKSHGHVFLVSFLAGILATAFAAYYSVTFVAVYAKYSPQGGNPGCSAGGGGCSTAKVTGLLVFITFAAYVSLSLFPLPQDSYTMPLRLSLGHKAHWDS